MIITGAASGVGYQLARILYMAGATVYIAARSSSRCDGAISQLLSETEMEKGDKGQLKSLVIDLADLRSTKKGIEDFMDRETRLDLLVHNAAVMTPPAGSKDALGHDLEFGTNCLVPYLMTTLLSPLLSKTAKMPDTPQHSVRIVWVTSLLQHSPTPGGMKFEADGTPKVLTWFMENYMQSKSGSARLAYEFTSRLGSDGILSLNLHPGLMRTELQSHWPFPARWLMSLLFKPALYGAYYELYAGFSPDVKPERNGGHYMAWGREADLSLDIMRGLKLVSEGGTSAKAKFLEYCDREIKQYL